VEFGGFLKRLLFENGVAQTFLKGPESPVLRQEERELKEKQKAGALSDKEKERLEQLATTKDINIPFAGKGTENSNQVGVDIQGTQLTLKAGQWSEWVPVTFKVNALVKVHGLTQFHLIRGDRQ